MNVKGKKTETHKYLICAVCGNPVRADRAEKIMDHKTGKLVPVHRECDFTPSRLADGYGFSWKSFEWIRE